jgi:hypothetical protein
MTRSEPDEKRGASVTTREADILGRGMARAVGRSVQELERRIKALEFALDTAIEPHNAKCSTRLWDSCDCGLRELMGREP